jgi:hypothetical protein
MLPRVLTNDLSESVRRRYIVVRLDNFTAVPGLIISADTVTGIVNMQNERDGSSQEHNFGPYGITIVTRR